MTKYSFTKSLNIIVLCIAICLVVKSESQNTRGPVTNRPFRCTGYADLLYRFCCVVPPFFTHEVARECGGAFNVFYRDTNVTGIRRHSYSCGHWYCVLDKYELLTQKGFIDLDKYFVHLDIWTTLNPAFNIIILDAKVHCKENYRFYLPLKPCEFHHLNACIRNYLKVKCPVLIGTEECQEQKRFFDDCGHYFIR